MASRDTKRAVYALHWIITLAALGVAILACFLPDNSGAITALQEQAANQTAQINTLNQEVAIIQSQLVEIMMDGGNLTFLRNGSFTWGISLSQSFTPPFAECTSTTPSGFTIAAAGSGYRVGDLATVNLNNPPPQTYNWLQHPVLRVDAVGGSGEVLALTALSTGCFDFDDGPDSIMDTLSVAGSGLTVQTVGPFIPADPSTGYYDYPTPPANLCAPIQVTNYSVYQLTIGPAAFTLLYLSGAPVPSTVLPYGIQTAVTTLQIYMYNFNPRDDDIVSLGTKDYIFPLTQKNLNAISFATNDDCLALGTCVVNINFITPDTLRAMEFYTQFTSPPIRNQTWIRTGITPLEEIGPFDNGVFSLNEPFMLVLPAL